MPCPRRTSAGALFGGILTEFLNWRWILFVNVPIGVVTSVAALRYVPESRAELTYRHLDLGGAVTVTAGLVAIVYAIVRTESYSWGSRQVLVPLVLGGRPHRRVPLPAGPGLEGAVGPLAASSAPAPSPVATPSCSSSSARCSDPGTSRRSTCSTCSVSARFRPGVAFLPQTLLIAAGAQIASRLVPRFGPRPLILIGVAGGRGRAGVADPDLPGQHVRRRPPGTLRPHRLGHGSGGHPDRRGRDGAVCTAGGRSRLGPPQHLAHGRCLHRPGRAGHAGRQPDHGRPEGRGGDPCATPTALTDGYALAFAVAAGVLVATAAVAWPRCPRCASPRRAIVPRCVERARRAPPRSRPTRGGTQGPDPWSAGRRGTVPPRR